MKLSKLSLVTFMVGLLCLPMSFAANSPAQAEYITSGTAEYDYPLLGIIYINDGGPIPFTAPQTVLLNKDPGFDYVQNAITSNSIDISFLFTFRFSSFGTFNGEVFKMPTDTIPGISVSQNMGATVTFDKHDIYVNWEDLPFTEGVTYVDIDVVPEPCSLLLFGSGLAGLIGLRRKYLG